MRVIRWSVVMVSLLAVLSGCDGCGSKKQSVVLAGRMVSLEIESSRGAFAREAVDGGWYHQVAFEETMSMAVMDVEPGAGRRDAPVFSFGSNAQRQTDTDLPDRGAGEYYKVRLVRDAEGRVLLETRQRFLGEAVAETNFEFSGEVEFVEGDWFVYEAGGAVAVRYSPAGLRASNDAMVDQLRAALEPALRRLFIEEVKGYKEAEGWSIADSEIGRVVHTESDAEFLLSTRTVYRFGAGEMSYEETRPTRMRLFLWFGLTDEHLEG